MLQKRLMLLIAVLLLACFMGCAAETFGSLTTPAPTPVSTPAATPAPTPVPFDPEKVKQAVDKAADLSAFLDEEARDVFALRRDKAVGFSALSENVTVLEDCAGRLRGALKAAGEAVLQEQELLQQAKGRLALSLDGLTWQYAAALGSVWGSDVTALDFTDIEAFFDGETVTITIALRPISEAMAGVSKGSDDRYTSGRCVFAYLLTVFDDEGAVKPYVYPGLPQGYEESVLFPLKIKTSRRNGWYDDRDGGARRHCGMDFRAREDTEILSCTDGEVTAVGYNKYAGNYELVMDKAGYEYHYYHMVRLTDFLRAGDVVKQGELLGHVGNTGNSDANHLHLTMITPEGLYINPYELMKAVYPY